MNLDSIKTELKQLIVDALSLEDIAPADIDDAAPLFGEGLGLDSIDSLELVIAIKEKFGVQMPKDKAEARAHFASVNALADFIQKAQGAEQ